MSFGFGVQLLLYSDVGWGLLLVLHVYLSLQSLATCWSLKRPKLSSFSTTNSRRSVRVFFKNCSHSFKWWGLLHKGPARVRRFLFLWFKPVARTVSFLLLTDPLPNLRWVPLPFSSSRGLLTLRIQELWLARPARARIVRTPRSQLFFLSHF